MISVLCQNVTREKLRKVLSYEKCARKMLMKLTPDGSRDYLKCSRVRMYTNQYFLLRGGLKCFKWSAHRKSLKTKTEESTKNQNHIYQEILHQEIFANQKSK